MRLRLSCLLVAIAVVGVGCRVVKAQVTTSARVPVKPWTPPVTKLPPTWIDAANFMLAHGMGDPRGGEYRKATVQVGQVWNGDAGIQTIHGWILPNREIVAWNGLTYRSVKVGEPADLTKDVHDLAKVKAPFPFGAGGNQEAASLKPGGHTISVPLLLILGKPQYAETVLAYLHPDPALHPLTNLVFQYAAVRFDRAVAAHMRGDDLLAAEDAGALQELRPEFESVIQRNPTRGVERMDFLEPCGVLVEDSLRRLHEPERKKSFDRIAALIQELDQVNARQWGQPGGVSLGADPIVQALVKEGNPAVDPLLDCMERDNRLTRSVSFGRDFFPARNLITVKDAAYRAICGIVDISEFGKEGARASVEELRAWWSKNRDNSVTGRWIATLADDAAGSHKWEEAAERITESINITHIGPFSTMGSATGPMKGEPARHLSNPSVSDLLARRAIQLVGVGEVHDTGKLFDVQIGAQIARHLAHWDPVAAQPVLKVVSKRLLELMRSPGLSEYTSQYLGPELAQLTSLRLSQGDDEGVPEFVLWLSGMEPHALFGFVIDTVGPFWRFPNNPKIRAGAKTLFCGSGSKWNLKQVAEGIREWGIVYDLIPTPMLQVPAFREAVVRLLDDRLVVGSVWSNGGGSFSYGLPGGMSGSTTIIAALKTDPYERDRRRVPYRVCDTVATQLTQIDGAPTFRPYWPDSRKDQAIAALKAALNSHGEELAAKIKIPSYSREP